LLAPLFTLKEPQLSGLDKIRAIARQEQLR